MLILKISTQCQHGENLPSFLVMLGLYQNDEVSRSNFNPGTFGLSDRKTSENVKNKYFNVEGMANVIMFQM